MKWTGTEKGLEKWFIFSPRYFIVAVHSITPQTHRGITEWVEKNMVSISQASLHHTKQLCGSECTHNREILFSFLTSATINFTTFGLCTPKTHKSSLPPANTGCKACCHLGSHLALCNRPGNISLPPAELYLLSVIYPHYQFGPAWTQAKSRKLGLRSSPGLFSKHLLAWK